MLSFEEADQLKDPARLRAFIKKYGIEYTVLLGGEHCGSQRQAAASPELERLADDVLHRSRRAGARRARRVPELGQRRIFAKAKEEFEARVERCC